MALKPIITGIVDAQRRYGLSWIGLAVLVSLGNLFIVPISRGAPSKSAQPAGSVLRMDDRGRPQTLADELVKRDDPKKDIWDSEYFSQVTNGQLKVLSGLLKQPNLIGVETVSPLIAPNFTCSQLRPVDLTEVFNDGTIVVARSDEQSRPRREYVGADGFVDALRHLAGGLGDGGDIRVKVKMHRVVKMDEILKTRILFEASNREVQRGQQLNAEWVAHWTYPTAENDNKSQLVWLGLEGVFEQAEFRGPDGKMFTDCTESAMKANDSYAKQIVPGVDYWVTRISQVVDITNFAHHGIAVGDVNGDGLEDVYVCETGGMPNRLYIQNIDGTVTDISERSTANWMEYTSAALLVDLDNDGDQDLVVSTRPMLLVAENDGTGRFRTHSAQRAVADSSSISAADYDADGDLDIFVCGYRNDLISSGPPVPVPYHNATNGGPSSLLRNDGNFVFTDVTKESGIGDQNDHFSLASSWEDFDDDGDLDLYVANDFGRNNLYRNDNGHFTDVTTEADVEDFNPGMSVSWGDYNRDGLMDLYVGNMFSAAGSRITHQPRFVNANDQQTVAYIQRTARGNSLFASRGDGTFYEVSDTAAVTIGRWAWSSKFMDLNNDGWRDLYVVNGYATNDLPDDL